MATNNEQKFLGQAGTEQLVATVKNLLDNKLDKDQVPMSPDVSALVDKIPQHYHNWQYFYVNSTTGNDENDGSENAPFGSIDKAFEKANEGWVNLRIYVTGAGMYTFSKRAFVGMALHIENTSDGEVILQQAQNGITAFYNSHINSVGISWYGYNDGTEWKNLYFEGSSVVISDCEVKPILLTYGGNLIATNVICGGVHLRYSPAKLSGITVDAIDGVNQDSSGANIGFISVLSNVFCKDPITFIGNNVMNRIYHVDTSTLYLQTDAISGLASKPTCNFYRSLVFCAYNVKTMLDAVSDMISTDSIWECEYEYVARRSNCQVVTTAGTNLDDYTSQGTYYFGGDYTPTNIPAGVNGWLMVIAGISGNMTVCKQMWWRHGTANSNDHHTYVRTRTGDGWSAWQRLYTSKDIIPIGNGGTGASTAEEALTNLGAAPESLVALTKRQIVSTAGEDIDTYTTQGVYYFTADYTPTNAPSGVTNGWLMVIPGGENSAKQIWWRLGSINSTDYQTFVRTWTATSGWSTWVQFGTDRTSARGGYSIDYSVEKDANNATQTGLYRIQASTTNGIGATGTLWAESYTNAFTVQRAVNSNKGTFHRRVQINKKWGEWEWENPPLVADTEYRTTERMNNLAVYKKYSNGVLMYRLDGSDTWQPYYTLFGLSNAEEASF